MNSEILRRAVSLADGWFIEDGEINTPFGICYTISVLDTEWPECRNAIYDALAAQLKRQLYEKSAHYHLHFIRWVEGQYKPYTVLHGLESPIMSMTKELYRIEGDDETENTITAIVESKVLE